MKGLLIEEVKKVMSLLETAGFEAFVVGGAVRDFCMGISPKDFDLATNATPEQMKKVFEGYDLIETGIQHGTITVVYHSIPIEITTYRIESGYEDSRHPDSVEFTTNLREDLKRRDFTINAMAYHHKEGIVDFFGGQEDIQRKVIRCVGNPSKRLEEDALRILRALRFASVLGFYIEDDTHKAIYEHKKRLKLIAIERMTKEITQLLMGHDVKNVLISYIDVIGETIPELLPMKNFQQYTKYHNHDVLTHTAVTLENAPKDRILRWVMLLHDISKPECFSMDAQGVGHFYGHNEKSGQMAEVILKRLRFDKVSIRKIVSLVSIHDKRINLDKTEVCRLMSRLSVDGFFDLIDVKRADNLGKAPEYQVRSDYYATLEALARQIIEEGACLSRSDLAVNGYDLLKEGYEGRAVGDVLTYLFEAVLTGEVENKLEHLLLYLKRTTEPKSH